MTIQIKYILAVAVVLTALSAPATGWSQSAPDPKLVESAKKEGQFVYYTTMTLDQSKAVVDRFEKKYGIKATLFRTGGGPLLNKIFTESRGGRHDWDVVVGRGKRVTVVCVSEFGRRVGENGTSGTDHGYGNVMMVLGSHVLGGRVLGTWNGLPGGNAVNQDVLNNPKVHVRMGGGD